MVMMMAMVMMMEAMVVMMEADVEGMLAKEPERAEGQLN